MKKKEEFLVLKSVLELEVKKGHQKWTIAELARKSGISRTLIYYHFGKTKTEIVKFALEVMGEEFFFIKSPTNIFENKIDMLKAVKKTRSKLQKNSFVLTFYYHWRYSESPIRGYLEEMELKFQKRLKKILPRHNDKEIIAIHAIMFGIVTAPFLGDGKAFENSIGIIGSKLF